MIAPTGRNGIGVMVLLLEREACLQELAAAWQAAAAGAGRIALVSGEAGLGKTTLVEHFARGLPPATRVLWGASDALFTPRPLGPLHDMAAQLGGGWPDRLSADSNRTTLFGAFLAELQQRPALVVFEDVHWADEPTLDLLRYAGRRISRTQALLVLTYRDDELGPRHPLRLVLGDLVTLPAARRIPLPPLSESAVRALVGERRLDSADLYRQTGGNPFFVGEVLSSGGSGIPATVREAVLARAARLTEAGQALLAAAAVCGLRIEPALLVEVAGADAQAADECLAAGILLPQGDLLAFRHELIRQTVLASLSPQRRQTLHQSVLKALRAGPDSSVDLARLAHHAEGAGDREAVLAYAPAAARQASGANAHRAAADLYALALRYADDLPPAERAQLLGAYADECNSIDQRAEGLAARQQALTLWQALGDPLKQGECLANMAFLLNGLGRTTEAQQVCRQALELLEAHSPGRELALAYRVKSGLHMLTQDYRAAIEWGEKAIALAEPARARHLVLAARNTIGSSWAHLDFAQGCQYLEDNLAAAHEAGFYTLAAHAYANLSSVSSELYRFPQAEAYARDGLAYAAEYGLERFRLYILAWQAVTHLRLGRWREAAETAALVLQRPSVSVTSRVTALAALGCVYARQGEAEAGWAALDEALELARHTTSLHRTALVRAARAEAAWLGGDGERAREEANAVFEAAVTKQHAWFAGELAYWRWRAGADGERYGWLAAPYALQVAGDWRAAAEAWERLGCAYERARALAEGGAAAQVTALEIFERLGARPAADTLRAALKAAGAARLPRQPRASTRENPFGLTHRQLDILALLMAGLTNVEIAKRLQISPKTADHHVSAILERLSVHSREAAAELARRHPHFGGQV
ncbi:MAG: AAA family ATPase [Anaerolineales bacterium]|nr:AAA family ATPase [Anaerolineales bacterium]